MILNSVSRIGRGMKSEVTCVALWDGDWSSTASSVTALPTM